MVSVSKKVTHPVFKKNQPDDSFKFQPLPQPSGKYPYHLRLQAILAFSSSKKMEFHMVGDTGSVKNSDFQRVVAGEMIRQYREADAPEDRPQFLYHLGDVVYTYGEMENYPSQFFGPYRYYPGPVFAIPGNHDGDVDTHAKVPYKSLDAFMKVFCDVESRPVFFSEGAKRNSMIQPNVYWTLETPLANIIGLYSNVPKFGIITEEQRNWFLKELRDANFQRPGKALIVCVHHAPYSADTNHGSSPGMIEFLERAFTEAGVIPDIVFSGHVHNYQRFTKQYADGSAIPYVVAGAGGYDILHNLVIESDAGFFADTALLENVRLEKYCDSRHGFLKVTIEKINTRLVLTGEYFSIPHEIRSNQEVILTDTFKVFCPNRFNG
jgi:hypothetical protein